MDRHEFTELLVYHGLRRTGSEWNGVTPRQLAAQYGLSVEHVQGWCLHWQDQGYYIADGCHLLDGYLTSWGRQALRSQA